MEGLALLAFVCCVGVVPLVLIVGIVAARTMLAGESAAAVGEALGFEAGPRQKSVRWYLGTEGGRRVGVVPVALRTTGTGTAPSASMGLRVVMAVDSPASDAVVYRPVETPSGLGSFEEGFKVEKPELVTAPIREAMLTFARENPGALRLRARAGASAELIPAAVMPTATMVLAHEFIGGSDDPEQVRARIEALGRVADVVEAER